MPSRMRQGPRCYNSVEPGIKLSAREGLVVIAGVLEQPYTVLYTLVLTLGARNLRVNIVRGHTAGVCIGI